MARTTRWCLRAVAFIVVAAVLATADWSATGATDPFRLPFLGPGEVELAGHYYAHFHFPPDLLVVLLLLGLAKTEIGLLIATRRPDSRIGLLLALAGLIWLVQGFRRSADPFWFTVGVLATNAYFPLLLHVVLMSPAQRLTSRVERVIVATGYVGWPLIHVAGFLVRDERARVGGSPQFGLLITDSSTAWHVVAVATVAFEVAGGAGIAAWLVWRYLRGSTLYRHAILPMAVAGLVKVVATVCAESVPLFHSAWAFGFQYVGAAAIPVGALVAVSRSTPSEQELQLVFAELQQDQMSLADLEHALRRATGDPRLTVLVPDVLDRSLVTLDGTPPPAEFTSPVDTPAGRAVTRLTRHGVEVGALEHDSALCDSPEILHVLVRRASLVLENAHLLSEVRRQLADVRESRRRIVEAADTERRRIERNVHDAVQQRLVAALLLLRRSQHADNADDLLQQGIEEVARALEDLRETVRGLHPPVLSERGLGGAVEALAERASVPVHLDDRLGGDPVPELLAATAYYVVAEAVTNVQKHAGATLVRISLHRSDGVLVVSVVDDGAGAARERPGGGLAGLRDRVDAVGGVLDVRSAPGAGTSLVARFPMARFPAAPRLASRSAARRGAGALAGSGGAG